MRISILSPLPPSKSGIADYTAALAQAMSSLAAVDSFGSLDDLPDVSSYDATIYQIGNNGDHGFVYEEALSNPGIVVLHEANLHHLIAEITIKRGDWDAYLRAVQFDGGPRALEFARAVHRLEVGPDYDGVPMLRKLLRRTRGLIVHSNYVGQIARQYGYQGPLAVIPHGTWLPESSPSRWRSKLAVADDEPLIGVFGHLKPYKRIAETLRAFRRLVRQNAKVRLILVGEPHPDLPVEQMIDALDLRANVRVIGYAPIEDFVGYLDACDVVVNLRFPTVGESSGSMLRALGLGKPVLVSDVGAFAEFPDEICLKVPVGGLQEEELIYEYLRYLIADPTAAKTIGERAREWVREECAWSRVAQQYVDFCKQVSESESILNRAEVVVDPPFELEVLDGVADALVAADVAFPETMAASCAMTSGDGVTPQAPTELAAAELWIPDDEAPSASAVLPEGAPEEVEIGSEGGPAAPENGTQVSLADDLQKSPLEDPLSVELLSWASTDAARQYLIQHLSRLSITLDMLPDGGGERKILEMGCYMQITPALSVAKHYQEVRGCYYGALGQVHSKSVTSNDGRVFSCEVDEFDAERDRYPYPDSYFDAVLCTELFEHLGYDPMHCLGEINRVLKPGGHLLLSTPNACSIRAVAAILDQYHPGFFPAFMRPNSTGEVDPRHHREYAPREIEMALSDAGFETCELRTGPYWSAPEPQHEWVRHLLEHYELDQSRRGECIFALGRKMSTVRNRFPDWLYYG